MKMLKALSGDMDIGRLEAELEEQGIREEDEVKVCELFDQYERRGIAKGEERLGKLMNFLMDRGRHDDAKRAAIDPGYRRQLYAETSLG